MRRRGEAGERRKGVSMSEPPRPRTRLLWITIVSLVVVVGVVVLVVTLSGRPDLGSARAAAEAAADAFEANDVDEMAEIACDAADEIESSYGYFTHDPAGSTGGVRAVEVTRLVGEGEHASVAAEIEITYSGGSSTDALLSLHEEDDSWCVNRISE